MIQCVKTGALCRMRMSGNWILGDAYMTGDGVLFVKFDGRYHDTPPRTFCNYLIESWFDIWGEGSKMVLVASRLHYRDFGYNGKPISQV